MTFHELTERLKVLRDLIHRANREDLDEETRLLAVKQINDLLKYYK